jgi:hypothetical protein
MVAPQDVNAIGVLDLEGKEEGDGFDTLTSSVHVVA